MMLIPILFLLWDNNARLGGRGGVNLAIGPDDSLHRVGVDSDDWEFVKHVGPGLVEV